MTSLKIETVLNTLEEDHQLVHTKMQLLRDTVIALLDHKPSDGPRILDRFEAIKDFFANQFASHLEEEELTLFKFLEEGSQEDAELVAVLREEHEAIVRKVDEFSGCLQVARDVQENLPIMVKRDLIDYGWELLNLIDTHAHKETTAVQEKVRKRLLGE